MYNPYGLQNWTANRYKNRYLADEHFILQLFVHATRNIENIGACTNAKNNWPL